MTYQSYNQGHIKPPLLHISGYDTVSSQMHPYIKIVLPARSWLLSAPIRLHADWYQLWNYFCFYTHHTVVLKSLSGKITSTGEPGDKASWLVEDWGYQSRALLGTHATQPTLPAGATSTTSVLYVDSVPPQRERACLNRFQTYESVQ